MIIVHSIEYVFDRVKEEREVSNMLEFCTNDTNWRIEVNDIMVTFIKKVIVHEELEL